MAEQPPSFQFEDLPLEEARRMGRGPRMDPALYETLRTKIQSLSDEATRIHLGPEMTPQRMRRYLRRLACDLNIPVTVRRVPGGLIFWRSTDEDRQQATDISQRLQAARKPPQSTRQQQPARANARRRARARPRESS